MTCAEVNLCRNSCAEVQPRRSSFTRPLTSQKYQNHKPFPTSINSWHQFLKPNWFILKWLKVHGHSNSVIWKKSSRLTFAFDRVSGRSDQRWMDKSQKQPKFAIWNDHAVVSTIPNWHYIVKYPWPSTFDKSLKICFIWPDISSGHHHPFHIPLLFPEF